MQQRIKKAACYAALIYCSGAGLLFGMLRAAQQTRRTLYGGQPVMAQVTRQALPECRPVYTVSLGGGAWQFSFSTPERAAVEKAAEQLPPCMGKLLVQIILFADRAADQTAEWISGM